LRKKATELLEFSEVSQDFSTQRYRGTEKKMNEELYGNSNSASRKKLKKLSS
jgi:hypothetical protein